MGGGGIDGFVTKLNATGDAIVFSTFLGGSSSDAAAGVAVDGSGAVYVTGLDGLADVPRRAPRLARARRTRPAAS